MKARIFFLLLVTLLAACSGKKAGQDAEIEDEYYIDDYLETQIIIVEEYDIISDDEYDDEYDNPVAEREYYNRENYSSPPLIGTFVTTVTASSELTDSTQTYSASNLIDATWRSWAVRGGPGESFTIELSRYVDQYYRNAKVTGFALKNGYGNIDYYSQNNRVKSFIIYVDGDYLETMQVKDSISFKHYYFKEPLNKFTTIQFVIEGIYPGSRYNDTCVAEVALLIQNFSDRIFYDNILLWIDGERNRHYVSDSGELFSVADADKISLLDYLPFDVPSFYNPSSKWEHKLPKTKIALLDAPSLLTLNNNLPRLDGATAMYPLYSSFVHAVYPDIKISMDIDEDDYYYRSFLAPLYHWEYFPNMNAIYSVYWDFSTYRKEFKSIVQCNTTSQAFKRLIDGEVDIIFCYAPSEAEIKAAGEKGLRFNLTPIAKDAFVFIVNDKNALNNISQRHIRDIYSGRVKNWKAISGVDEPIIAYQRPANSGSQTTLQSIMGRTQIASPLYEGDIVSGEMGVSVRKVASNYYNYNSAIGYSFRYYLTKMIDASGVKILSVDGVAPTRQNIQNNRYPFVQTVYAITTGSESENTKKFIDWIISAQGQELVDKTGYVPN